MVGKQGSRERSLEAVSNEEEMKGQNDRRKKRRFRVKESRDGKR